MGIKVERLRDQRYLDHIRGQPCLACGSPGEAHHIQYAQPRAMARKTGDQWVVPLCHSCHMMLHDGPWHESTFWSVRGIDPVAWAEHSYKEWKDGNQ